MGDNMSEEEFYKAKQNGLKIAIFRKRDAKESKVFDEYFRCIA